MVLVNPSKKRTIAPKIRTDFLIIIVFSTLLLLWLFQDISSRPDTFMNTVRTLKLWSFHISSRTDTFMNTVSTLLLLWSFQVSSRPDTFMSTVRTLLLLWRFQVVSSRPDTFMNTVCT